MKTIIRLASALLALIVVCGIFASCGKTETNTVKIGVTGAVYEDIWAPAIAKLKEEGINVELVQYSDFSIPNNALSSGDIDLNAFQHHAYFRNELSTRGYDLTVLAPTFVISMNLFSKTTSSVDEIKEGDVIAVPNDATNYGRALLLLADAGLLTLKEDAGDTPTTSDIVTSKVVLQEVNAALTYTFLDDKTVTAAVVNGNYAASYGVDPNTAIFYENLDLTNDSFTCLIACRTADKDNATYKTIAEVFCSEVTENLFEEKYKGFFVPAWNTEN